tara:strand:- start:487 stop:747 length:261 start_codon:yes stop_codon:yes gene_type:complete
MTCEVLHQEALCECLTRTSSIARIALNRRHSHSAIVAAALQQLLLTEQKQLLGFFVVSSQYLLNSVSLESITEALQIFNCTKEQKS